MFGQMMQMTAADLVVDQRHADRFHGGTQIVSRMTEGGRSIAIPTRDAHTPGPPARPRPSAARGQGSRPHRHARVERPPPLEIYYAVSGMGAVCHTINPRLFPEQIVYIINHAEDSYVFFDI